MEKPRWLDDEPEIRALLGGFLDKLDRKAADEWRQPPAIKVEERHLPTLFRFDADADRQWTLLKSLDGAVLDLRLDPRRAPYDAEYAGARVRLILSAEETVRSWLDRPRVARYAVQWREAVERHGKSFADGGAALFDRPIHLPGKSAAELVGAFAGIAEHADSNLSLRQLSARCFWGHSKFLDDRMELVTALVPCLCIRPRPVLVNVFLPEKIAGVLFIENQDSYTRAVAGLPAEANSLALIYASGFRGSAQRIREPSGASLHYHAGSAGAHRATFESWWFSADSGKMALWFWGDLDFSGIAILKALRGRFGDVQAWEPGYRRMLKMVREGNGHTGETGDKEDQASPGRTGCVFADQVLLPAIEKYGLFVDQEAV